MSSKITTSASFTAQDASMMATFASSDDQWGWTHYGFYILDLPAPLGYFNANTVIGTAGSHTFNRPVSEQKNPTDCRRDCSLHVSTGGDQEDNGGWTYGKFDTADPKQASLAEDGRLMQWTTQEGGVFQVRQNFPQWHLKARFSSWEFDLTFHAIGSPAIVTHFAKIKKQYEHFSIMARAEGTFRFFSPHKRQKATISSNNVPWSACVEYARSITPQMLSPTPLPKDKMVPDTMFTYQILTIASPALSQDIHKETLQILIARTGTRKKENIAFIWIRSSELGSARNVGFPAKMRIVRYQKVSTTNGDQETAIVPAEIEWTAGTKSSQTNAPVLMLNVFPGEGETGNLWRGKFGAGFNTGCRWTGTLRGENLLPRGGRGRGHVEWVDVEASEADVRGDRHGQAKM